MREFLFHGKRIDNGEWVEGYLVKRPSAIQIGDYSPWYIFVPPVDPDDDGGCYNVDPATVGQYTGRTDKNKRRVFEGDIIRLCNGIPGFDIGAILWDDNDQAYLIVMDTAEKVLLDDFGNYGRPEYYEVIGNIYDNPELVGGATNA